MCCDEGVKDLVVKHCDAAHIIRKMVVLRLLIVIEDESFTSNDDSLWVLGDSKTIDLIQIAIECL